MAITSQCRLSPLLEPLSEVSTVEVHPDRAFAGWKKSFAPFGVTEGWPISSTTGARPDAGVPDTDRPAQQNGRAP